MSDLTSRVGLGGCILHKTTVISTHPHSWTDHPHAVESGRETTSPPSPPSPRPLTRYIRYDHLHHHNQPVLGTSPCGGGGGVGGGGADGAGGGDGVVGMELVGWWKELPLKRKHQTTDLLSH